MSNKTEKEQFVSEYMQHHQGSSQMEALQEYNRQKAKKLMYDPPSYEHLTYTERMRLLRGDTVKKG